MVLNYFDKFHHPPSHPLLLFPSMLSLGSAATKEPLFLGVVGSGGRENMMEVISREFQQGPGIFVVVDEFS